ncbi:uncharacterized protein T551_02870 [Pneumocystis jirovecii RU7]|uniref:Sin1 middle CRIM domain-containing protein n=1 Tax=Pneumocystis jirovecii (strain RU7) TaxID=1408657 RepID=A0A0W4ZHR9_PNEJ7|nr:uncharacterized protein T551_02870 [Pneumocystis jirovecii RU7]KTW27903.1 hypothetical protein T551_02870 [Pneumocystis jirovecii RU7]
MSLLYDSKTLIQQLRAKYLETVNDAVGERVIGSKKSYLNKKKLYESVESIVEHENETPLFMKGRDPLLNAKGIGAVENYKLGNTFYYQKSDTEKTTNRKCLQADRNFFPLSAKIVSSIDESDSDDSQVLSTNGFHLSLDKGKFKPKSVEIIRRTSKNDLNSMINNHCLISSNYILNFAKKKTDIEDPENKYTDNCSNTHSKELKSSRLTTSYSSGVLNKSLESICPNELSSILSNPDTNDAEDICLNNMVLEETSPNFSQESSSTQLSSKNSSLLTILIKTGKNVQVNPLDIYASLSGKGDLNPLKLKIYRPSGKYPKKPISVVVKRIATVADVIGFSLYCFIEQKLEPKLTNEQLNPNMWTLRIVEEDGELDEDFPALDRVRFLSKFGFDEFALVEATSEQFLENEKITPFNFKINIEHFNSQTKNDLNDTSQILFSSMLSKDKAVIETPESFIRLKVLLYPRIQSLKNSILYVTNETYIGNVLDEICRINNLDQTKFILRIAETNTPLSNDCKVYDLKNQYELELIERSYFMIPKFERFSNIERIGMFKKKEMKILTYAFYIGTTNERNKLKKMPENKNHAALDRAINNSYEKYIVWRRQSMSFMGRHERMLVIDGDYIYIMPLEQKTFFDTPKTLSIHTSTIVNCKQTDKLLTFNFTVMKSKELKKYDFEASSKAEASLIVAKINALINSTAYSSTKV